MYFRCLYLFDFQLVTNLNITILPTTITDLPMNYNNFTEKIA
jgi:hypothetical protein